jgi:hypothetical protein
MPDDLTTSDKTPSTDPAPRKGKRSRRRNAPQPLTVFTGSHGLQAGKPRAGEDADQPADPAGTTDQTDTPPDLRR